jgi:lysozyme
MRNKLSELLKYLKAEGLSEEAGLLARIQVKIAQQVYLVKPGDNLGKIAQKHYGKASYSRYITNEDGSAIVDPLQVGQKLLLGAAPQTPNSSMNFSQQLVNFLTAEGRESLSLEAYDDKFGNMTIGYGHKLDRNDKTKVITLEKAKQFLKEDLAIAADFVRSNTNVKLSQNQFDALVSIVFNTGRGNFANSDLLTKINSGDLIGAGKAIKSSFISAGGKKNVDGLMDRRELESKMFLEGAY